MTTHKINGSRWMRENKVVGIISRAYIVSAIALSKYFSLPMLVYDLLLYPIF